MITPALTLQNPDSNIDALAAGPGGTLWFTGQAGLLGRVTTSGSVSELRLPPGSAPDGVTAGPGNTLWVAEQGTDSILRITLPR